jgi:hypothetical protein
MTTESDASLEGWSPEIRDAATLAEAIERAFDYRGDVTIVRRDGTEVVGYLYNRDAAVARPFVQVFEQRGGDALTLPYADIQSIRFTGRDTAAGNSYAAWLRTREAAKAARSTPDV